MIYNGSEVKLPDAQALSLIGSLFYYSFSTHECYQQATYRSQSQFASDAIFYGSLVAMVFYIYIISIIWWHFTKRKVFTICATVLFIADIIALISSCREGVLVTCVFLTRGDFHMAWQAIGTFCMDLRCAINCLLALVRFASLIKIQELVTFTSIGALLSLLLAITTFILAWTGHLSLVWFEGVNYHDTNIYPTNTIRKVILLVLTFSSVFLYVACMYRVHKLKTSMEANHTYKQETAILFHAILLFLSQLIFIYSSFWFGSLLGIGDDLFNATLYYTMRPVCAATTPIVYSIFIHEIRQTTIIRFSWKYLKRRLYPNDPIVSTTHKRSTSSKLVPVG